MFKQCIDALHHVIDTEGVMSDLRQVSFIFVFMSPSYGNIFCYIQSKDKLDLLKHKESTVIQQYISQYEEEEQLNKHFQEHANRCRQGYNRASKKGLLFSFYDLKTANFTNFTGYLDVVMAPGTVIPRDRSFKKLVEKFNGEGIKQNAKFLKRLLR